MKTEEYKEYRRLVGCMASFSARDIVPLLDYIDELRAKYRDLVKEKDQGLEPPEGNKE